MIYPYDMVVSAARNRDRAYEAVIKALEGASRESGVTRKQVAEKMGQKPSLISTWLSGPSNWTLDTVDHLLRAVGAEMEYSVVFDSERSKENFHILPDFDTAKTTEDIAMLTGRTVVTASTSPSAYVQWSHVPLK